MSTDLSIVSLIVSATPLVQLVMLLLLLASLASWTVIFSKRKMLAAAHTSADEFEKRFWSSQDLTELYNAVAKRPRNPGEHGLEAIFEAGFRDFVRLRKDGEMSADVIMAGVQRSMRVALNRESEALEHHLPMLGSIGSTSPYIGLFGTVWGIMNSFRALGTAKQATLNMVAPGIAEALIATAMGLFAAIPAVIGYNRYLSQVDRLLNRYDSFFEEFSNILQRQAHR